MSKQSAIKLSNRGIEDYPTQFNSQIKASLVAKFNEKIASDETKRIRHLKKSPNSNSKKITKRSVLERLIEQYLTEKE